MLKSIKFLAVLIAMFGLSACESNPYGVPYYHYIINGKVIDSETKEPIGNILVSVHHYDMINAPAKIPIKQKTSPIERDGNTDKTGEFSLLETYFEKANENVSLNVYFMDRERENLRYQDTAILVNFKDAVFSGTSKKYYKGDCTLTLTQPIELQRIN